MSKKKVKQMICKKFDKECDKYWCCKYIEHKFNVYMCSKQYDKLKEEKKDD